MKRGTWLINLASRILESDISLIDGFSFALARFTPKPISILLKGITFNEVDHIFWSVLSDVFINRVYLPANFMIHNNDTVVDIGAHRGGFTSFAAQQTSNMVIAFEPDPMNFSLLEKLIEQNHLRNVVAHNAAVGSKSGKSKLLLSASSSRHRLHSNPSLIENSVSVLDVDVLSLDECLAPLESVQFLKMDCEGAEFEIVMHAETKTLNKIEMLAMETHDPIHSPKIRDLCNRLKTYFPNVKLVDQKEENLGYLYAWKSNN